MAIEFPTDFFEFLSLLSGHSVEYLLIGGYAVGFHGYPRATGDLDIWIACCEDTATKMVAVYQDFGIEQGIDRKHFLNPRGILRMGTPPNRLAVTTCIDGVEFTECLRAPRRSRGRRGDRHSALPGRPSNQQSCFGAKQRPRRFRKSTSPLKPHHPPWAPGGANAPGRPKANTYSAGHDSPPKNPPL